MAIILQPQLNIYMKPIKEGNLYNVEQSITPKDGGRSSSIGLEKWKKEVRKQLMKKLRGYSPQKIDSIIKSTFGDSI